MAELPTFDVRLLYVVFEVVDTKFENHYLHISLSFVTFISLYMNAKQDHIQYIMLRLFEMIIPPTVETSVVSLQNYMCILLEWVVIVT